MDAVRRQKILRELEEYDKEISDLARRLADSEKALAGIKQERLRANREHHEELAKMERKYNEEIEKLKDVLKKDREMVDYLQASMSYPPVFVGHFLRLDEKVDIVVEQGEDLPPKIVPTQTALVSIRGSKQTVAVEDYLNIDALKTGVEVFLKKHPKSHEYAIIVGICPVELSGRNRILKVKRVLDESHVILNLDGRWEICCISGNCEKLEKDDKVVFDPECNFVLCKAPDVEEEIDRKKIDPITFKDIGGLEKEKGQLEEIIKLPFEKPEFFKQLGVQAPKSAIFVGPPGTGKTLMARAAANEADMAFFARSGSQFQSSFNHEDVENLKMLFEEAKKKGRAIIFIDEFESLAPMRSDLHSGQHDVKVLVNAFLALMDGIENRGDVIVLAATNNWDEVDEAARRRFDRVIHIPVPDKEARRAILKIHSAKMPLADDVYFDELLERTHGFVGDDIRKLCMITALLAKEDLLVKMREGVLVEGELEKITVKRSHFMEVLRELKPSGVANIVVGETGVAWEDVGGLRKEKEALLREIKVLLGTGGKLYQRAGLKPRKGILLIGWPGCGKTYLVRGVATRCKLSLIPVSGADVREMWVGKSARNLMYFINMAQRHAPSILFFDEVENLFPHRGGGIDGGSRVDQSLVAAFSNAVEGIRALGNVIIIAATNRPDLLDIAVLRRLLDGGEPIKISKLDKEDRKEIFEIHAKNLPLAEDVNLDELAEMTGARKMVYIFQDKSFKEEDFPFVGNEIRGVCEEADRLALNEFIKEKGGEDKAEECYEDFFVCQRHFKEAIAVKLFRDQTDLEIARKKENDLSGSSIDEANEMVDKAVADLDLNDLSIDAFGGNENKAEGAVLTGKEETE